MARARLTHFMFKVGKVSAEAYGLSSIPNIGVIFKTLNNGYVVTPTGFAKRPGFYRGGEAKNQTGSVGGILTEFAFGENQSYALEWGDQYLRFYTNGRLLKDGDNPVEIDTPYQLSDLPNLKYVQRADEVLLVDGRHYPQSLIRSGPLAFSIDKTIYEDPPYLDMNENQNHLLTLSAPGPIGATVTVTSVDSLLDPVPLFNANDAADDVYLRVRHNGVWGTAKILTYINESTVTAEVIEVFNDPIVPPPPPPSADWHIGAFSERRGYPSVIALSENRLIYASTFTDPTLRWTSVPGNMRRFTPGPADSDAIINDMLGNKVNKLLWMASTNRHLLTGTLGGTWVAGGLQREPLTPSTAKSGDIAISIGVSGIQPENAFNTIFYIDQSLRKVHEAFYNFDSDSYVSPILNHLVHDITGTGVIDHTWQQSPYPIYWAVTKEKKLIGMTYDKLQEIVAWHTIEIGGTDVEVLSCVTTFENGYDRLWIWIKREIDGADVYSIEYLTFPFRGAPEKLRDSFYVDGGISYKEFKNITDIEIVDEEGHEGEISITVDNHGLIDGDQILIEDVKGMIKLNNNTYHVDIEDESTFVLVDKDGEPINGSDFKAYKTGGIIRKYQSKFGGLEFLKGETVNILADGAVHPSKVVADDGTITLEYKAAVVHAGLPYTFVAHSVDVQGGSVLGSSRGERGAQRKLYVDFINTVTGKYGTDANNTQPIISRKSDDIYLDSPPPLLNTLIGLPLSKGFTDLRQFYMESSEPLPFQIGTITEEIIINEG